MKILVTGSSAFIGSTIAESLSTKYNIYSPTSSELDLLDSKKVKNYLENENEDISRFKPLIKLYDRADIINDIA